jgi:hypothetical protein
MFVKLIMSDAKPEVAEVGAVAFASFPIAPGGNATESQLEALIAANIELFMNPSEDEEGPTLLVIGRQVRTTTSRTMDLVAIDGTGALTLIEVKRDAADVQGRSDHAEIQAVRYAASLGKLRSVDDLVTALYGRYIEKYESDDLKSNGGGRSAEEWARKRLIEFMKDNNVDPARLNHRQNIVIIGAGFDRDTISAAAWMAKNGLPIQVIHVEPRRFDEMCFLDIKQLIPIRAYEDFFVDLTSTPQAAPSRKGSSSKASGREYRLRLPALLEAGKLKVGDRLLFKLDPTQPSLLKGPKTCEFNGKEMSLLEWTKQVSGWSAVNVYDWVVHEGTGKLLEDLRVELEDEQDKQSEPADAPVPAPSKTTESGPNARKPTPSTPPSGGTPTARRDGDMTFARPVEASREPRG